MTEVWDKTSQNGPKKAFSDFNVLLKAAGSRGVGCWDKGFAWDSNGLSSNP